MPKIFLFLLLFFCLSEAIAQQNYLKVYKSGGNRIYYFPQGRIIKYRAETDKAPVFRRLEVITPFYFISNGIDTVYFKNITHVWLPEQENAIGNAGLILGSIMMYGGFGFALLDVGNQVILGDRPIEIESSRLIPALGTGVLGFLLTRLKRDKIRIRGRWKIILAEEAYILHGK